MFAFNGFPKFHGLLVALQLFQQLADEIHVDRDISLAVLDYLVCDSNQIHFQLAKGK